MNKIIMIVGTLGCGKSSVGRQIAKSLNVPFVDSDAEVEKAANCSVRDFFEIYGEDKFRECEHRVLNRLLAGPVCVLSSGGGSFLHEDTRKIAAEKAVTVWLKASEAILFARLKGRARRPQVPTDTAALKEMVAKLVSEGNPIYSQADIVVESLEEPPFVTARKVLKAIEAQCG